MTVKCRPIFCETEALEAVYREVSADLPHCRHAFVLDGAPSMNYGTLPPPKPRPK